MANFKQYWLCAYAIVNRGLSAFLAVGVLSLLATSVPAADKTSAGAKEDDLAEIVVTGSLIADPNNRSASPIVITTAAESTTIRESYRRVGTQSAPHVRADRNRSQRRSGHRRSRDAQLIWTGLESKSRVAGWPALASCRYHRRRRHQSDSRTRFSRAFKPSPAAHRRCTDLMQCRVSSTLLRSRISRASLPTPNTATPSARRPRTNRGFSRVRQQIRGRQGTYAGVGRGHSSSGAVGQSARILRLCDAVLVYRTRDLRSFRIQSAEPGGGEQPVHRLRRRDAGCRIR